MLMIFMNNFDNFKICMEWVIKKGSSDNIFWKYVLFLNFLFVWKYYNCLLYKMFKDLFG